MIEGPDGVPLTDYEVEHDKELHLVVVGRDLARTHTYTRPDADGIWTVTAPPLAPGSYRVFADFVPAGGEGMTLAPTSTSRATYLPPEPRRAVERATVDGYDVSFDGELVAGTESELTRHRHPRRASR